MATTNTATTSPLGYGMLATFCTVTLPVPDPLGGPPIATPISTVQPTFGVGVAPGAFSPLPSVASGRLLLGGALVCRLSTDLGTLPDVNVPTALGNYGVNIADSAYADMTADDMGALGASIDAQVQMDQRVRTSTTTVTGSGGFLLINIAAADGAGPFPLVLAIDALTGNLSLLSSP